MSTGPVGSSSLCPGSSPAPVHPARTTTAMTSPRTLHRIARPPSVQVGERTLPSPRPSPDTPKPPPYTTPDFGHDGPHPRWVRAISRACDPYARRPPRISRTTSRSRPCRCTRVIQTRASRCARTRTQCRRPMTACDGRRPGVGRVRGRRPFRRRCAQCAPCQPQAGVCAGQRPTGLDVVVELEFVRVRAQPDRVDLVRTLPVDPGLDQVRREHSSLEQEFVVGLEGVENLR